MLLHHNSLNLSDGENISYQSLLSMGLCWVMKILYLAGVATCSETASLILGGVEKIFLEQHSNSPLLNSFELFGCSGGESRQLVAYPTRLFGANMAWEAEVIFQ